MKQDLRTKTALVTGGTRDIGQETARELARLGATVAIVGRDKARGRSAARQLSAATANPNVDFLAADLSSQAAVRGLATEVTERYGPLHILINNAAALYRRRQETVDGLEATLALAHLAPVLLTELLLPVLQAGSAVQGGQRQLRHRGPHRA